MREKQRVADMADEVLARQAVTRAVRTGEQLNTAFEAVLETEADRRLGKPPRGPHRDEGAQESQEGLMRERTGERQRRRGREG